MSRARGSLNPNVSAKTDQVCLGKKRLFLASTRVMWKFLEASLRPVV